MGEKEFRKELQRLNQELQQENAKRMQRMLEHKRKQILENHVVAKAKTLQKKNARQLYDCMVRKQAVDDHVTKDETLKMLGELMKADPYKLNQRSMLVNSLHELNNKLGLNMPLRMPEKKKVQTEEINDDNE